MLSSTHEMLHALSVTDIILTRLMGLSRTLFCQANVIKDHDYYAKRSFNNLDDNGQSKNNLFIRSFVAVIITPSCF